MLMKRTPLSAVLAMLMILVFGALPAFAQTEEPAETDETESTCEFDLAAVRDILDEADAAFADGDQESALALLDDAEDALDAVSLSCQTIPDLVETSFGDILTFGVPEDWVTNADDDDPSDGSLTFIMATDGVALDASMGSTPSLTEDQQVIGVLYAAGDEIASMVEAVGDEITLDTIVQGLIASLDDDGDALLTQPEPFTVKDWRAQNFRLSLDGSEATAYIVEVKRGEAYVVVIGIGANGRLDEADAVARAVVDTLDYNEPVAATAPDSGSAAPTATAP